MKIKDLENKKIAILGFWAEWKSTLTFLKKIWIQEEKITILDKESDFSDGINMSKITAISWEHYLDNLTDFDIIIKTPWISPYHKDILPYKEKLTSQTEIFFNNYSWKVIWVTATKGKSTTVSITYETLDHAWFNVKLVGNIWSPVLDEVDITQSNEIYDYVIYELSSYMLEGFSPELYIWVLWNIFRCHIDWHNDDYEVYKQAKINILQNAKNIIINHNLLEYSQEKLNLKDKNSVQSFWTAWDFSYSNNSKIFYNNNLELFRDQNILLEGEHNRINTTSILAIIHTISQESWMVFNTILNSLKEILSTFKGLPHRMEDIWTYHSIRFIDDSISTTPDSTVAAIKTFSPEIGTIFLWGFDYGFEFKDFTQEIKNHNIKNIVFFPDTWSDIKKELDAINYTYNWLSTDSMKSAVEFAYKNSKNWEVVLLSCASPSFSMYNNYKERGYDFKRQAEKLAQ